METLPPLAIRKIIHIDMDAFYASVEQRDRPELRGKPVAVGGSRERGVVAAASYEARRFGVHSALPAAIAARRCPELIFVKPDFAKYQAVSAQIRAIFLEYTDLVEPLSLDEAYLDVTDNKAGLSSATRTAREIRARIYTETGLRASAGISVNKFVAKVASDLRKPNNQKTILPEEVLPFLEQLPIAKFFGIGPRTAERMQQLGVHRGADLKAWPLSLLIHEFGKKGAHYYHIVRGIHDSPVRPHREAKSIGAERTFDRDLRPGPELDQALRSVFELWLPRLKHRRGRSITLKVKFHDFSQITRSRSYAQAPANEDQLWQEAQALLHESATTQAVRLLGLSLSKLEGDEEPPETPREPQLKLQP